MSVVQKTRDVLGVESLLKTLLIVVFSTGAGYHLSRIRLFPAESLLPTFAVLLATIIISLVIVNTQDIDNDVVESLRSKTIRSVLLMLLLISGSMVTAFQIQFSENTFSFIIAILLLFSVSDSLSDVVDVVV